MFRDNKQLPTVSMCLGFKLSTLEVQWMKVDFNAWSRRGSTTHSGGPPTWGCLVLCWGGLSVAPLRQVKAGGAELFGHAHILQSCHVYSDSETHTHILTHTHTHLCQHSTPEHAMAQQTPRGGTSLHVCGTDAFLVCAR